MAAHSVPTHATHVIWQGSEAKKVWVPHVENSSRKKSVKKIADYVIVVVAGQLQTLSELLCNGSYLRLAFLYSSKVGFWLPKAQGTGGMSGLVGLVLFTV